MSDERILENIKKLKALGMPDDEIIDNLVNIGLSKEESERLVKEKDEQQEEKSELKEKINDIKNEKKTEKKINKDNKTDKKEIPDNFFDDESGEIIDDNISEDEDNDYKEEEYKRQDYSSKELDSLKEISSRNKDDELSFDIDKEKYKPEPKEDLYAKYTSEQKENKSQDESDIIWQKGLLTTINSKLTELDNKQKDIERTLKIKIQNEFENVSNYQEKTKKEISTLVNELIQKESEKLNTKIITEVAKLKIIEAKINNKIQNIEEDKNKMQEVTKEFDFLKNDLKSLIIDTKKRTESIIAGTESNFTKIITTTTVKLNEKMKEINSTLALQSKITEGLVKNTQNTISTEMKKLNDFQNTVKSQIDPKRIYDKLKEIEDYKITLGHRYEERFEKVKVEFLQKAKVAIKNEVEKDLKDLEDLKKNIADRTDPEKIEKKLQDLRKLEEEVIASVDTKIQSSLKIYEASITKEFKDKMDEIEKYKTSLEKTVYLQKDVEEKIKEIDKFKKQFIAVIDENIEKMNQNMSIILQKKRNES